MICPKCNQANVEGAKFCSGCGSPLTITPDANAQNTQPQQAAQTQATQSAQPEQTAQAQNAQGAQPQTAQAQNAQGAQPQAAQSAQAQQTTAQPGVQPAPQAGQGGGTVYGQAKPSRIPDGMLPKIIAGAGAAVVVLVLIIVLAVTHKTTIKLEDYTTVTFNGYDGYGTAEVSLDYDKMTQVIAKKGKFKGIARTQNDTLNDLADSITDAVGPSSLAYSVSYDIDKDSSLSNGDKVKVVFSYDNDIAKKFKIKFKGESVTEKAEGLKAVKQWDPFKDLKVTFSGTSPDCSAEFENTGSEPAADDIYYEADSSSGLAKGDKITVTVNYDEDTLLEEYGVALTQDSKEYEVDNVDAYAASTEDITDEVLADMKDQTVDVITAYGANNKSDFTIRSAKYVGYYFLTEKSDSYYTHNYVYIVYSAVVRSKNKSFKPHTVYFPVEFTNVIKYADGTGYVDLTSNSIRGTTDLEYGWWSHVSGYTKIKDMKSELVTARKGEFNEEIVGNLK